MPPRVDIRARRPLGVRSRELLDGLRGWMARHSAAMIAVLLVLIGAKLIGDAASGFST